MKNQNIVSMTFFASLLLGACMPSLPVTPTPTSTPTVTVTAPTTHTPLPTFTPEAEYLILQEGNKLPKTRLSTKTTQELADNHIGGDIGNWEWVTGEDNSATYHNLQQSIYDLGLKWVRTNFWSPNPLNWQEVLREPGVYDIPEDVDGFITDLSDQGVNVVLTLSAGAGLDDQQHDWWGGPGWGALGDWEPDGWFKTQDSRDGFTDYARFMVQHFKGRIAYYEIWNEPSSGEWDGRGAVAINDYVALVKQVIPVIKQADPEAKVVVGAMGRFRAGDQEWLQSMLQGGLAPLVDGISWHPFYGESPLLYSGEYPQHPEPFYWRDYPQQVQDFQEKAASWGFQGEYMAEEMVWRTQNDLVPGEAPLYTDVTAAKYAARAIIMHLGMNFTVVSNQMLMPGEIKLLPRYYVIRNLCTVMAGAQPVVMDTIELEGDQTGIKKHAFLLPNGDLLIALWSDDIAVDENPGMKSTLVIRGSSAQEVTGIDVLNGLEQSMITNQENGDLLIRNIYIKDYPLIFRIAK